MYENCSLLKIRHRDWSDFNISFPDSGHNQ